MGKILKKIALRIYNYLEQIQLRIIRYRIESNPSIQLGHNVTIKKSTVIETKSGGTITIGNNTEFLENVIVQTYGGNIVIGDNCSINAGTIIYGHGNTTIGNNVLIAGGCMIIPTNHVFIDKNTPIMYQGLKNEPIVIEDDVWIAHGCSILAGVTIGRGSIIAAGCVVNKNVDEYSIYAGVPAKKIGERKK